MKKFLLLIIAFSVLGVSQKNFAQPNLPKNDINLMEVRIEIKRDGSSMGCIGCTPEYSASIDGNGIVHYEGFSGVKLKGRHTFSISVEQVKDLLENFRKINFASLEDSYTFRKVPRGVEKISHGIKTTTTLIIGNKTKSVFNFHGAPKELDELQEKINEIIIKLQEND
jgi:hypothetical protein